MGGKPADESGESKAGVVNDRTMISIGVVALIAGAIWWAATLQAKVDSLLTITASNAVQAGEMRKEIDVLRERVLKLENHKP